MSIELARRFVQAVARGDFEGVRAICAPAVKFRYATPIEARAAEGWTATQDALRALFPPDEKIADVAAFEARPLGDRFHVCYRMRGIQPEYGAFEYEQHGYLKVESERIVQLRIVCSGFYPPGSEG